MFYLTVGQEKLGFLFDIYSKVFRKLGFKRYTLRKGYRRFPLHLISFIIIKLSDVKVMQEDS
jgi:hypothetical protein